MNASLDSALKVRSMVYLASEEIPNYWPMRTFINHNPLHGLEHLDFGEAVERASDLFGARGYLPRATYQAYLAQGDVDPDALSAGITALAAELTPVPGVDLGAWVGALFTGPSHISLGAGLASGPDVAAVLHGSGAPSAALDVGPLVDGVRRRFLGGFPLHAAVDALYGTRMGDELNAQVIRCCLAFFDEGQAAWPMPGRHRGLFHAWRDLVLDELALGRRARALRKTLVAADSAESVIIDVLTAMEVPEDDWTAYFTRELATLHGWSGFIRWRSGAKHYHWNQTHPGDLVDLMAIRLALASSMLSSRRIAMRTRAELAEFIDARPQEMYLRSQFYGGKVMPRLAVKVERALARGRETDIDLAFDQYTAATREHEASDLAARLQALARLAGQTDELDALGPDHLGALLGALRTSEQREGMVWLRAMESQAMKRLTSGLAPGLSAGLTAGEGAEQPSRPFAQALFCIDTRSERLRRKLEGVGDYQTFGIAGFFGVPVSFIELGKGSETHLCPVIVTPDNVVLEIAATGPPDHPVTVALGDSIHELKDSVVTPFVTVEAIGLLFGFDMLGKTLGPARYHAWRGRLDPTRPRTHLLVDKLDRARADSIVRAVQRGVILRALEHELGLKAEGVTDGVVRELREAALGNESDLSACVSRLSLDQDELDDLIDQLRTSYAINAAFADQQLGRLGRIGFSLNEQVNLAAQALTSIGLTGNFSRFVLLVGHGSTSENNPFESALDCGACGGNHGLVSARVLAQIVNKPQVRRRLVEHGIVIPDDTWFVPALHNTTTDDVELVDLELIPPAHLVYIDRLRQGLTAASRLCAQERIPSLEADVARQRSAGAASARAHRNSMDWSQVRPEWGLARNAFFVIGSRDLTRESDLEGRAFLHSYDYRNDPKRRLLENILAGPLVVGQWINLNYYFSTVDNQRYGSGSKVNHNVSARLGVMTGSVSDLRAGLPAQTVLMGGRPYHEPIRLITVVEAPLDHARRAVEGVIAVRQLLTNGWLRLLVADPATCTVHLFDDDRWHELARLPRANDSSRKG